MHYFRSFKIEKQTFEHFVTVGPSCHYYLRGAFAGTPNYLPKEVLLQLRVTDCRADVFGVGCILYELIKMGLVWPMDTVTSPEPERSLPKWEGLYEQVWRHATTMTVETTAPFLLYTLSMLLGQWRQWMILSPAKTMRSWPGIWVSTKNRRLTRRSSCKSGKKGEKKGRQSCWRRIFQSEWGDSGRVNGGIGWAY